MEIFIADNFWLRFRGLMFRKKPVVIVFPFKKPTKYGASIHSFFVFFDFYAIYINKEGIISEKILVKPFVFRITPKEDTICLIEVPVCLGNKFNVGEYFGKDLEEIKTKLKKKIFCSDSDKN